MDEVPYEKVIIICTTKRGCTFWGIASVHFVMSHLSRQRVTVESLCRLTLYYTYHTTPRPELLTQTLWKADHHFATYTLRHLRWYIKVTANLLDVVCEPRTPEWSKPHFMRIYGGKLITCNTVPYRTHLVTS